MADRITDADILGSRDVRNVRLARVNVLDKVGALAMLPDDTHATTEAVAAFYGVSVEAIKSLVSRHRDELNANGRWVARGSDLREIRKESHEIDPDARSLALFTRRAVLNVGMLLRDSEVAKQVRAYLLEVEEAAPPDLRRTAYERLREKAEYSTLRALIAETATDYSPNDDATRMAFARAQNLLYRSTIGMDAAQLIASGRPLTTHSGKNGPTKADRKIAKNYLTSDELNKMTSRVTLLLAHVNVRFENGTQPSMKQWLALIEEVLPQPAALA
ncbi:RhuM family protein [Saccharomonospora piscinae]|nr:RhuM family protein [Saccharomonospora piscinae]